MLLALTGGTGFVGGHAIDAALARGHRVRALARREQPTRDGVEWVRGDLADAAALRSLCEGADAVVHIAGVTNARDRAGFDAGNVEGTRAMVQAARDVGSRRFVHVSSLAAREPELSIYGASKAAAETVMRGSGLDWVMLRPPGVYGPRDTEILALFKAARWRVLPLPAGGRAAMVYAADLAAALVALAESGAGSGGVFEIDDGHGGYTQAEIGRAAAWAMGVQALVLPMPVGALRIGAMVDTAASRLRGRLPTLSFDRARYLAHPDWTADSRPLRALGVWEPAIGLNEGMRRTAAWYRAEGWL